MEQTLFVAFGLKTKCSGDMSPGTCPIDVGGWRFGWGTSSSFVIHEENFKSSTSLLCVSFGAKGCGPPQLLQEAVGHQGLHVVLKLPPWSCVLSKNTQLLGSQFIAKKMFRIGQSKFLSTCCKCRCSSFVSARLS